MLPRRTPDRLRPPRAPRPRSSAEADRSVRGGHEGQAEGEQQEERRGEARPGRASETPRGQVARQGPGPTDPPVHRTQAPERPRSARKDTPARRSVGAASSRGSRESWGWQIRRSAGAGGTPRSPRGARRAPPGAVPAGGAIPGRPIAVPPGRCVGPRGWTGARGSARRPRRRRRRAGAPSWSSRRGTGSRGAGGRSSSARAAVDAHREAERVREDAGHRRLQALRHQERSPRETSAVQDRQLERLPRERQRSDAGEHGQAHHADLEHDEHDR